MSDWQEIATAPLDQILMGKWFYHLGEKHWVESTGRAWELEDGFWPWSKKRKTMSFDGRYYTHWKPLPEPPK